MIRKGGDNMRDDRTYTTEPYMSTSPKGQIVMKLKRIQLQNDKYVELPYPLNLDEFDLEGPYLRDRILFYEIQHMNDELNELCKKINDLLKEEE